MQGNGLFFPLTYLHFRRNNLKFIYDDYRSYNSYLIRTKYSRCGKNVIDMFVQFVGFLAPELYFQRFIFTFRILSGIPRGIFKFEKSDCIFRIRKSGWNVECVSSCDRMSDYPTSDTDFPLFILFLYYKTFFFKLCTIACLLPFYFY